MSPGGLLAALAGISAVQAAVQPPPVLPSDRFNHRHSQGWFSGTNREVEGFDENLSNATKQSHCATDDCRVTKYDTSSLGLDTVKQFSGYIDVKNGTESLFYWFFESRNNPETDPIVMWLNGGMGCSSLKGLSFVMGPSTIGPNLTWQLNEYAWNNNASLLFLEQPAGAGLSYGSQSADNVYSASFSIREFLRQFFGAFPEYSTQPFHLTGHSDAGLVLAQTGSDMVLDREKENFNFKGLAMSNALLSAKLQYQTIEPLLCGDGGYPRLLDETECSAMRMNAAKCVELIDTCSHDSCVSAEAYCNNVTFGVFAYKHKGNFFNLAEPCDNSTSECYAQDVYYETYFAQPEVQRVLGASKRASFNNSANFAACNRTITEAYLRTQIALNSGLRNIARVLDGGVPVLLFAGDADTVYTWIGMEMIADLVAWNGQQQFEQVNQVPWVLDGKSVANIKHYDKLTFVRVFNAGHLVPHDQPETSLELINNWMAQRLPVSLTPLSLKAAGESGSESHEPNTVDIHRGVATVKVAAADYAPLEEMVSSGTTDVSQEEYLRKLELEDQGNSESYKGIDEDDRDDSDEEDDTVSLSSATGSPSSLPTLLSFGDVTEEGNPEKQDLYEIEPEQEIQGDFPRRPTIARPVEGPHAKPMELLEQPRQSEAPNEEDDEEEEDGEEGKEGEDERETKTNYKYRYKYQYNEDIVHGDKARAIGMALAAVAD